MTPRRFLSLPLLLAVAGAVISGGSRPRALPVVHVKQGIILFGGHCIQGPFTITYRDGRPIVNGYAFAAPTQQEPIAPRSLEMQALYELFTRADSIKGAGYHRGRRPRDILADIQRLYAASPYVREAHNDGSAVTVSTLNGAGARIDLRYIWRLPRSPSARNFQILPDLSDMRAKIEGGTVMSFSPGRTGGYNLSPIDAPRVLRVVEMAQRGDSLSSLDSQLFRGTDLELIRHPLELVRAQ